MGLDHAVVLGAGDFLTPQAQVLIYTVVVFLLLLAVLWKYAWGPLMKALEEREQRIAKRISDAEAAHQEALAKLADYEKRIATAKEEAAEIIAEGKRDVVKVKDEILAEAQAESTRTLERAKREIVLAKEAAVQELREKMVDLTSELARRVIQREVKPEDHRRFIQDAIAQVDRAAEP
jgi:F-type H+-transporting ATPase subunit b